jgi:hypothetical protein
MTDTEFDVDQIVDRVAGAVSAGKYHDADETEVLLIRLNALEEIVKTYRTAVQNHCAGQAAVLV